MRLNNLSDLFALKLKALYDVEMELTKALPTMAKQAVDPDLKESFEKHFQETRGHVVRIEKIFGMLNMKPSKTKSEAIRGIVADAEWGIKQKPGAEASDALLIASARYAEHYETAGYLTAIAWARLLGYAEAADLLEETLEEEEKADEALSQAAESRIDQAALDVEGEEDDGADDDEEG